MKHEVFGEIEHDYFWIRDYSLDFWNQNVKGVICIEAEIDEEIQKEQIDAYKAFEERKEEIKVLIEEALYSYYLSVVDEYRDRYGDEANEFAPIIKNQEEMKVLLTFESINVPYSFANGDRVIGVLFKSKWEVEHGVAVKIVNEEIVEVGYQDIVL